MMQQKISTPSVINILDTKIRSSQAYAFPEVGGIAPLDPWDTVLSKLEPYALDPDTVVASLRGALTSPNASNPVVTVSKYENRFEARALRLIGPVGSEVDFEGSGLDVFQNAMASLPSEGGWLVVLPGTYIFDATFSLRTNVRLMGVHPETTILKTSGNFPLLALGTNSLVDRFLLDGTGILDQAVVILSGEESALERCSFVEINRLGASLVGARSRVLWSKFSSTSNLATTVAASFNGHQQIIEFCKFDGEFLGAAIQFENRESTLSNNVFSPSVLGPAYKISSISQTDNKIVFNHFCSQASLNASLDRGTSTIRYGNTPNNFTSNVNNALTPLKSLTGQPSLTSSEMVLSNSFTHDPSILKNASSLWGSIDLFTQKLYEERNLFLTSDDPVFDPEGQPISGIFSWDGSTNTLTWPSFTIRSLYGGRVIQSYANGSMEIPPGFACVASLETSTLQKISVNLPLTDPQDANQLVLLRTLSSGRATWLHDRHLFPGNQTTVFDVHGGLLPISRYVGLTEARNPALPSDGFVASAQANLTAKIKDSSSLLELAYERTNLQYTPETEDSLISTDPTVGAWYDSSVLLNGISTSPTHLINLQGTLYGLLTNGLYYFDRSSKGWRLVQGNPASGPFSSMTRLGTNIALLQASGGVVVYNPNTPINGGTLVVGTGGGVKAWNGGLNLPVYGQTFTNVSGPLQSIAINVRSFAETITRDLKVELYVWNGAGALGPLVAESSTVSTGALTNSFTLLTLPFPTQPTLSASASYALIWSGDGGWPLVAESAEFSAANTYANGTRIFKSGTNWMILNGDYKLQINTVAASPWTFYPSSSLTIRNSVSLPLATTAPSSSSYYEAGQVDFAMQTSNYSIFTTSDGKTLRYYQDENYIDSIPRVFTEAAGSKGLLSYHPKDTGYNIRLDLDTLIADGDNGGFLKRSGLPLSRFFHGEILVPPRIDREAILQINWANVRVENFAFCQPTGNSILVVHNPAKTVFYILIGGPGSVRLAAVLDSTYFNNDFTPHSWVLNPYSQSVYILGCSASNSLVAYHGSWSVPSISNGWGASDYTFTRRTLTTASCSGVIANLDLYNDTMGTRDVIALACDSSRNNRPTWWRYSVATDNWTAKTFTDQVPTQATDVQLSWASANSFQYNFATERPAGFGVASPLGFQFLVRSMSRSGRPTLFRWLRDTDTFQFQGLGSPDGLTLAGADSNAMTRALGAVYHPTFKAVMWLSVGAQNQLKIYTLFEAAAALPTVWSLSVLGLGGTYLSSLAMGQPNYDRCGSMLGRSFGDTFLGSSSVSDDVFVYSRNQGVIRGVLAGSVTGFTSQTWSVINSRPGTGDQDVFSNTPTNTYQASLGMDRGGELSVQFSSFAEPSLPVHGASSFGSAASDYEGVSWFDTGSLVRNIGAPHLWAGLNRGFYLWIANARSSQTRQVEYSYGTGLRGDVILSGFPAVALDFDWDITPDGRYVGIVFRTLFNPSVLVFVLYDVEKNTAIMERANVEFTGTYITPLSSSPQVVYNSVVGSWDIVASEGSRAGEQLVFYRRLANQPQASLAWSGERVGSSGEKPLASMVAQAGRLPAKPVVLQDGSVLVATESGANANVLIVLRSVAGEWSTIHQTVSGGFLAPKIAKTENAFWVIGGSSRGQSGVLRSTSGVNAWTTVVAPDTSQTTAFSNFCRAQSPVVFASGTSLYVASVLNAEAAIPDRQEIGVFTFSEDNRITGSAFAAKSRLGQISGQEETNFGALSWTYKGDLLYAAFRPGLSARHWTLVRSSNGWRSLGESVMGSGRLISIAEKQYREELVSLNQAETKIITEYPSLKKLQILPLATKGRSDLFGLNWRATPVNGPLFGVESSEGLLNFEATLPSGSLSGVDSRRWPRIYGNTHGLLSGASVFGYGAGLTIKPPTGSSGYFGVGVILPALGIFRAEAIPSVSFQGIHTFRTSDSSRQYTIQGPISFTLSEKNQNLVLEFLTNNSLVLDPAATGLSYWLNNEHPTNRYAIILGQTKEKEFLVNESLLGGTALTQGIFEPKELSTFYPRFDSRVPSRVSTLNFNFEQIPTSNPKRFKFKIEGTNHGMQSIDMSASSLTQLVVRGPLALGFYFIDLVADRLIASGSTVRLICSAHSSGDVIVVGE